MKKRNINCDILRIMAFCFVILVHSLTYIGFYGKITTGLEMLIVHVCRCLFITCVPLFLILTGYLMLKKELNKDYFKKIGRIILTYLLCSIVCLIGLHFVLHREIYSIKNYIFSILNFTAAPYSWYLNMYLGLFFIIPFLNILWKNLNQKQKKYLIFILVMMCAVPTLINIYKFDDLNWWMKPSVSSNYQVLFPNWWTGVAYPILYYFIGCYLREYKLNIKVSLQIILLVLSICVFGAFNFYRNYGSKFIWSIFVGYYSFEAVIISTLLASIVLNEMKFRIKHEPIGKFIAKMSYLTFGAYLLSAIFDNYYYWSNLTIIPFFAEHILIKWAVIVMLIILSSLLLSYIVDLIERLIMLFVHRLKKKKGKIKLT